ncbi:MAG: serine protein kinase RIO [Candidatus Thermoplasmatota archaeon]|nr:serine protein kinase RIO [Candidatus Thermoplasmatota archaeon]
MDEKVLRLLESKVESWRIRVKDAEERKTYDEVFDHRTLLTLQKLISNSTIETIDYPISTGKEGNVFRASSVKGPRAVKIYRTSSFRRISKYIEGDPRFPRISGNRRRLMYIWASKEFRNLNRMATHGVRVPKPYRCLENVLVMSYLGSTRGAAPELRNVEVDDPDRLFELFLQDAQRIHQAKLVHGDLSEYNILIWRRLPYIIDVGQAVPFKHPHAEEWFERDMQNMARYFTKIGVEVSPEDLARRVRGG